MTGLEHTISLEAHSFSLQVPYL